MDYSQLPLRAAHLPDAVSWWPPAPGWWFAALLAVGVIVALLIRHRRRRRRRVALRAIRRVAAALAAGAAPVTCLQQLSALLRRFAMSTDRRGADAVAGLVGHAWLSYLDSRWSRRAFTAEGRLLIDAPYAPSAAVDRERAARLVDLGEEWIKAQPTRAHLAAEIPA